MKRHVVVRVGDDDQYSPSGSGEAADQVILRFSVTTLARIHEAHVWRGLEDLNLAPPQIAIDFYHMAAAVFSADQLISRAQFLDGWEREIVLHLPVADPALWEGASGRLMGFLRFLTGDSWSIAFRQGSSHRSRRRRQRRRVQAPPADTVCLLSGGLDSFAGGVDALAGRFGAVGVLACVSHNAGGSSAFSSPAQDAAIRALRQLAGADRVQHFKASVYPMRAISSEAEPTQRSRSIMFVGLGVLIAAALPGDATKRLLIPENGFITLNVPLTDARHGTLSTRTTHPFAMGLLADLLSRLGLPVRPELPYQFLTKGQMLEQSGHPATIRSTARSTVSCAHPGLERFAGLTPRPHCGYCIPCMVRRAAMYRIGLDKAADYSRDVVRAPGLLTGDQLRDLRALQMALARRPEVSERAAILSSGPIPGGPEAVARSIAVYHEGLNELDKFLRGG